MVNVFKWIRTEAMARQVDVLIYEDFDSKRFQESRHTHPTLHTFFILTRGAMVIRSSRFWTSLGILYDECSISDQSNSLDKITVRDSLAFSLFSNTDAIGTCEFSKMPDLRVYTNARILVKYVDMLNKDFKVTSDSTHNKDFDWDQSLVEVTNNTLNVLDQFNAGFIVIGRHVGQPLVGVEQLTFSRTMRSIRDQWNTDRVISVTVSNTRSQLVIDEADYRWLFTMTTKPDDDRLKLYREIYRNTLFVVSGLHEHESVKVLERFMQLIEFTSATWNVSVLKERGNRMLVIPFADPNHTNTNTTDKLTPPPTVRLIEEFSTTVKLDGVRLQSQAPVPGITRAVTRFFPDATGEGKSYYELYDTDHGGSDRTEIRRHYDEYVNKVLEHLTCSGSSVLRVISTKEPELFIIGSPLSLTRDKMLLTAYPHVEAILVDEKTRLCWVIYCSTTWNKVIELSDLLTPLMHAKDLQKLCPEYKLSVQWWYSGEITSSACQCNELTFHKFVPGGADNQAHSSVVQETSVDPVVPPPTPVQPSHPVIDESDRKNAQRISEEFSIQNRRWVVTLIQPNTEYSGTMQAQACVMSSLLQSQIVTNVVFIMPCERNDSLHTSLIGVLKQVSMCSHQIWWKEDFERQNDSRPVLNLNNTLFVVNEQYGADHDLLEQWMKKLGLLDLTSMWTTGNRVLMFTYSEPPVYSHIHNMPDSLRTRVVLTPKKGYFGFKNMINRLASADFSNLARVEDLIRITVTRMPSPKYHVVRCTPENVEVCMNNARTAHQRILGDVPCSFIQLTTTLYDATISAPTHHTWLFVTKEIKPGDSLNRKYVGVVHDNSFVGSSHGCAYSVIRALCGQKTSDDSICVVTDWFFVNKYIMFLDEHWKDTEDNGTFVR
jgi:hypothetical protein